MAPNNRTIQVITNSSPCAFSTKMVNYMHKFMNRYRLKFLPYRVQVCASDTIDVSKIKHLGFPQLWIQLPNGEEGKHSLSSSLDEKKQEQYHFIPHTIKFQFLEHIWFG